MTVTSDFPPERMPDAFTVSAEAAALPDGRLLAPVHLTVEKGLLARVSHFSAAGPRRLPHLELGPTLLLPGFVNAHCHLELTAAGPLPRSDFVSWVRALMARKARLADAEIVSGMKRGILSLAKSGVTTICDHVGAETPLAAYEKTFPRIVAFGEALGVDEDRAERTLRNLKTAQKLSAAPFHVTPHAVYSLHRRTLAKILDEEDGPFSVHVAESAEERDYFAGRAGDMERFLSDFGAGAPRPGPGPFGELLAAGLGTKPCLVVHGNYLDETQLDALAALPKKCVVHCPGSFGFFGHAEFPYEKIKARGIPVALGTDSLASNEELNFLGEIKLFLKRRPQTSFAELLPMLARNALHVLGRKGGEIAEGAPADLAGFSNPDERSPLNALRFAAKADFVMAGGKMRRY